MYLLSYIHVRNPVWIETTVCLYLQYICHPVIHRELQNVVYMEKNRCSRKRREGPVHKYLCMVGCLLFICFLIRLIFFMDPFQLNLKIIWQFHAHPVHQKVARFFGPRYIGDDFFQGRIQSHSIELSFLMKSQKLTSAQKQKFLSVCQKRFNKLKNININKTS